MRKYYNAIDLIRFVAACLVLIHHMATKAWFRPEEFPAKIAHMSGPVSFFTQYGGPGWVGVEIFFVISGIVIANSAFGRGPAKFVIGRASRLYPAAILCAPLAAVLLYLTGALPAGWPLMVIKSMVLLPKGQWIDPVFWTLGVEIVFYGLVALWTMQKRASLEQVAVGLTLWSTIWTILALGGVEFYVPVERALLLRFGSFFALGIFMWLRSEQRATLATRIFMPLAVSLGAIEIVLNSKTLTVVSYNSVAPLCLWGAAVWVMADSLANASTARSGWMTGLGKLTYPLYLSHTTVVGAAMYGLGLIGFNATWAFLIGSGVAIFVAWVIANYWEPPVCAAIKAALTNWRGRLSRSIA